jgi:nitrous-oxide reductase
MSQAAMEGRKYNFWFMGAIEMKKFVVKSTALLLAAGLGHGVVRRIAAGRDEASRPQPAGSAGRAKTYVPTGKRDEFVAFSSGGQSGQVIVYGIPSMRILKYIGVFTPEPWQGYGFDESSKAVLRQGRIDGKDITWGDTHHPAISETKGEYDGQFLFINDKANPRLAVIDLRDFETKQIVVNPIFKSEHGGAFVTPNTEYVIEAAQYAAPLENKKFYPLEEFNEKYRGGVTYWKFDRKEGRIDPKKSFSLELPPYSQDLSDAGKGPSDGWSFTNSFCSERYVGGIEKGRPPYEAGCSAKDTDYLHVINWKKAAELVAAGKAKKINGHNVLMMETAIKEGILFLVPEPKIPHGVDVTPDGKFIIVPASSTPTFPVYSFEKIRPPSRPASSNPRIRTAFR